MSGRVVWHCSCVMGVHRSGCGEDGGTGERVGRGGRGRGPKGGNDDHVDELNGQGNDQGVGVNGGIEGVNGNVEGVNRGVGGVPDFSTIIAQQFQNLLPAIVAQDMSGFSIDQKVKYTAGSFVGKALTFHKLARLVPHLVTPESRKIERYMYGLAPHIRGMVAATEPKTMQISGALVNEVVRNGSIKMVEKRGNMGEPSKDKNGRDDNKRNKTRDAFATTSNPVGRENTGAWPSVPPATPTMHLEGLVAHASTVTAHVIL
nr:reverse transcriptase domain-containing protein [Tanacetum cinerariifolium]